jgi:hypothetical protein
VLEHAYSERVPKLVRATMRRVDFGTSERVAHDRADGARVLLSAINFLDGLICSLGDGRRGWV